MPDSTTSKRRWAPKGKGGCRTCKSRHVRCDEQQPRCTPCQKSLRQCEYSADPEPAALKVVLWKPKNLVIQSITQIPAHTSDEARAFDFFRTKVAVNLAGFFDSSFWTHDILQVAQKEDPIRHAIVALASLSESMLKTSPDSAKALPDAFAIRQHTKAVSNLRQKMQENDESSAEFVLITCVLLICFEMFQNHNDSALSQMSTGIYVFYNWHSKRYRQAHQGSPRSSQYSSKLITQLEGVFRRLMLQTIMFIDTKPREWKFITPDFTPALPSIPSIFKSIEEARDCLDSCTCALYHRMLTSQFRSLEANDDVQELPDSTPSQLGNYPLEAWLLSFKYFMAVQKVPFSPREQKAITILQIQQVTGSILASAAPFSQEMIFDLFEEGFSQIVALASQLLTAETCGGPLDHDMSPFPAFEMGILPPLYFGASRCRHPSIRRQAYHLLLRGPRQEGIWHREALASIAERIINMEEIGCKGARKSADIPASSRLSVINATIDSSQRMVTLHCCRQQIGAEGVTEVMHELVEY